MSPTEFLAARERLGLSQVEVARFLGKGDRIIRRYEHGQTPVPRETAMLLRLMLKMHLTPAMVTGMTEAAPDRS